MTVVEGVVLPLAYPTELFVELESPACCGLSRERHWKAGPIRDPSYHGLLVEWSAVSAFCDCCATSAYNRRAM